MTKSTGEFEVTKEAFARVLEKFKTSNKINYNFLVKGGDTTKNVILRSHFFRNW